MKDSWKPLDIGAEINILSGYPFNSKLFNNEKEGKPLIRIRDILNSSIETYFSGPYSDLFIIKKGDILVGMDGEFHVAKWNNIDALLNQRILKISQKKDAEIDIDYFHYFLFNFLQQIHNITPATTVKHLSTFDIKKAVSAFPSVSHQRKIAKILNTTDAMIGKTEAGIAKYKSLKKGMMQDLFTRGIDLQTDKLRPSPKDAPKLYKETELGWIPKEWEITTLGEIGSFSKGNNIPKSLLSNSGAGCIVYGQIYTTYNDNVFEVKSKIPFELTQEMKKLKKGDILFAGSGETHEEIGKCIAYQGNEAVYPGGDIVILSLNENQVSSYFGYYLNHYSIQKQKSKLGQGSSVIHIYSSHLKRILIALPPQDEQLAISGQIKGVDQLLKKEQTHLYKHQSLKKGLMQDLLTGKVEVEA